MVSNLVPSGLEPGYDLGLAQDPFANEKKSGFDILPLQDLQHLRVKVGCGASSNARATVEGVFGRDKR